MIITMKILFVCKGNVGRSQMATTLYNTLSQTHDSLFAGTHVHEKEGQKIKENPKAEFVIAVMREEGADVSDCVRKQVTFQMVEQADKVVVMVDKEELPSYLTDSP